ncbi:MarR family winged helix-turn-helix transcriptional regulator [Dactylosporangium sp. NPDC000521]|uniref:MarR family winged helix-turn-helix transcriptional regulator n=1 Tax=Dactylosporangium sp. NPDC000521 TaxID=3363975 RepID=UPI0036CE9D91
MTAPEHVDADLAEAFLTASRVLVAIAVRSLDAGDADISLPQHRALVLLAARGPQRMVDLAELLGVNSSTATRHCDRLQRRGLVQRDPAAGDRRAVQVSLTPAGHHLVERITDARRREINRILSAMPSHSRPKLLLALRDFAGAAGEVPDQHWTLGWGTERPTPPAEAAARPVVASP